MRELQEELEMTATAGTVVARVIYHYEHGSFEILAIEATRLSAFQLRVRDECAWVTLTDLTEYDLAPADLLLVEQLRCQLARGIV